MKNSPSYISVSKPADLVIKRKARQKNFALQHFINRLFCQLAGAVRAAGSRQWNFGAAEGADFGSGFLCNIILWFVTQPRQFVNELNKEENNADHD